MIYQVQIFKLLFAVDDHIFRIGKAEQIRNPWKTISLLALLSVLIYTGASLLGIGSSTLSSGAVLLSAAEYEVYKFWFIIGRIMYSLALVGMVLFIPSLIYYWVTKIPYKKLLLMQVVVLFMIFWSGFCGFRWPFILDLTGLYHHFP